MISTDSRQEIHLLPEFLIDQIKAGEVIERPSTLIKEILENSIDAGSTKCELHIVNNGLDMISLKDNGKGILYEDLPYAFCRHATSKITRFNDLYDLSSFGFRGEALASIASVAKVNCISKVKDYQGGQIAYEGGQQVHHFVQEGLQTGTHLVIKDLFYNTPVRLKFTKSQNSEKNALTKTIDSFLVSHPEIEFHIKWDDKEKEIYQRKDQLQRIQQVIGNKRLNKDDCMFFEKEYDKNFVKGFISPATFKGQNSKYQFLFVNNRLVNDKSLHHTVINSLSSIWPYGEQGAYVVMINVPKNKLDVNVHPNKIIVKFEESNTIYSLLSSTLKALCETDSPTLRQEEQYRNSSADLENFKDIISRNEEETDLSLGFKVNERYYILRQEKYPHPLLIDVVKLYQTYIIENFEAQSLKNEAIPLLISLPFNISLDQVNSFDFKYWEDKGFEFDLINENSLVLRTIPKYVEHLNYRYITEVLLQNSFEFDSRVYDYTPSAQSILEFVKAYSVERLISHKVICFLEDRTLNKLFYDGK